MPPVTEKVEAGAVSAEVLDDLVTEETMRAYYAAQPKVSIRTKEDQWVQTKGYTFIIKGGERVDVPKGIAEILEESGRI